MWEQKTKWILVAVNLLALAIPNVDHCTERRFPFIYGGEQHLYEHPEGLTSIRKIQVVPPNDNLLVLYTSTASSIVKRESDQDHA